MGIHDDKRRFIQFAREFAHPDIAKFEKAIRQMFAEDAEVNVVHPFNELSGGKGYFSDFIAPLFQSFEGLYRRDDIIIAGQFEDGDWVSATGYYVGHFKSDWLGIKATGRLAYLRFGEFHKLADGKIIQSFIFLDIPELMIASNQWPIKSSPGRDRGYTGFLPGPATRDGVLLEPADPKLSQSSFEMVTEMLRKLATKDEAWRPYWHENMMWYGPAAFGSFVGIENFSGFQVPFENAFIGWKGGAAEGAKTKHFTRFGDGNYICSGGWPSLSGIQIKPFLDQPASNEMLFMRVCDWWRREDDKLVENWVFVDIPHALLQLGYDLFAEAKNMESK